MLRKLMIHSAILCIAAAPAAHAACPTGSYTIGLKAGDPAPASTLPSVTFLPNGALAPVPRAAGCPGWNMAALKLVFPAGCTQANVLVEYEGLPKAWTLNLGDSSTNDGFAGGGANTTPNNAELWVLNEGLSLANAGATPAVIDNPHATQHLALTDGALKFVVKNQFVSWGQPYGLIQTPASKNLFAIPDTKPKGDQRTIYLGLNRVIFGPGARVGCGARRALITFQ